MAEIKAFSVSHQVRWQKRIEVLDFDDVSRMCDLPTCWAGDNPRSKEAFTLIANEADEIAEMHGYMLVSIDSYPDDGVLFMFRRKE